MLIFGLGYDALLWVAANPYGQVHFVENSGKWIDKCSPIPNVHKVAYRSRKWPQNIIHPAEKLHMDLPEPIEDIRWNIIFVDAPRGRTHGRMRSIHNAHRLAKASGDCTVFVHDYPRPCEKLYVNHYFGQDNVEVIKRLAKVQL